MIRFKVMILLSLVYWGSEFVGVILSVVKLPYFGKIDVSDVFF